MEAERQQKKSKVIIQTVFSIHNIHRYFKNIKKIIKILYRTAFKILSLISNRKEENEQMKKFKESQK